MEIKSNQYEGEIYLDNTKVKVQKIQKNILIMLSLRKKIIMWNVTYSTRKREVIIEPIGPTLKLSLDRKLIDYCRKV